MRSFLRVTSAAIVALALVACDNAQDFEADTTGPQLSSVSTPATGPQLPKISVRDDAICSRQLPTTFYRCIGIPSTVDQEQMVEVYLERDGERIADLGPVNAIRRSDGGMSAATGQMWADGNTIAWVRRDAPNTVNVIANGQRHAFEHDGPVNGLMVRGGEVLIGNPNADPRRYSVRGRPLG